jgi:hypothetical protein
MTSIYWSKAVVGPGSTGWLVGWGSNQLTARLPQWPRLRIVTGQELLISIDPQGGQFLHLICDTDPARIRVTAVIEPDEQVEGKWTLHLLPFPPFERSKE